MKQTVTLALETGIYGGSICLLNNGKEISGRLCRPFQTKSKDFLELIREVLRESQISIGEVSEIVISVGPGSYTGIRTGYSLAKGLKTALGVKVRGVSLLDEMLNKMRPITIAIIPFGKTEVCWKANGGGKSDTILPRKSFYPITFNLSAQTDLVKIINRMKPDKMVLPARLHKDLSGILDLAGREIKIIHCEENLACLLGKSKFNLIKDEEVKIFYPKTLNI